MLPAQYVYAKKMCPAQVKPASVFKRDHASVLSSQPSGDIVQGGTPSQIQVPCDTKKYSLLQSEPALEVPGHAEAGYPRRMARDPVGGRPTAGRDALVSFIAPQKVEW
jgi:hypothetical protein